MKVGGFQKLTLLDYPERIACLMFTKGCNLKCPFCQNGSLVLQDKDNELVDELEIIDYLEKRKKILDGICISGGEPLIQKDIETFIKRIREIGYKIKLDTNGTFPDKLEDLINKGLIDYVAMDIKNSFDKYAETTGTKNINIDNIKKSINILKNSNIDYEFRTTIIKEYHDINNIKDICKIVDGKTKYYLQNYVDSENVIKKGLHSFSEEELLDIMNNLKKDYDNVFIR